MDTVVPQPWREALIESNYIDGATKQASVHALAQATELPSATLSAVIEQRAEATPEIIGLLSEALDRPTEVVRQWCAGRRTLTAVPSARSC